MADGKEPVKDGSSRSTESTGGRTEVGQTEIATDNGHPTGGETEVLIAYVCKT